MLAGLRRFIDRHWGIYRHHRAYATEVMGKRLDLRDT